MLWLWRPALGIAALLAGCGGGSSQEAASRFYPTSDNAPVASTARPLTSTSALPTGITYERVPLRKELVASGPLPPATSEDAQVSLTTGDGRSGHQFRLEPAFGRGYEELMLVIKARRMGDIAPHEPVRPACSTVRSCDYSLMKAIRLEVSDPTLVRLAPRGDGVAIVPLVLRVDQEQRIEIKILRGQETIGTRHIVLLPA